MTGGAANPASVACGRVFRTRKTQFSGDGVLCPRRGSHKGHYARLGAWEWAGYIALWVAVALSAIDQALKLMPELAERVSPTAAGARTWFRTIFAFAPLVFLILATAILVARATGVIGRSAETSSQITSASTNTATTAPEVPTVTTTRHYTDSQKAQIATHLEKVIKVLNDFETAAIVNLRSISSMFDQDYMSAKLIPKRDIFADMDVAKHEIQELNKSVTDLGITLFGPAGQPDGIEDAVLAFEPEMQSILNRQQFDLAKAEFLKTLNDCSANFEEASKWGKRYQDAELTSRFLTIRPCVHQLGQNQPSALTIADQAVSGWIKGVKERDEQAQRDLPLR